jgi:hypothetical protein
MLRVVFCFVLSQAQQSTDANMHVNKLIRSLQPTSADDTVGPYFTRVKLLQHLLSTNFIPRNQMHRIVLGSGVCESISAVTKVDFQHVAAVAAALLDPCAGKVATTAIVFSCWPTVHTNSGMCVPVVTLKFV